MKIEEFLTGSAVRFSELYRSVFPDAEAERLVYAAKKQNRIMAILLLAVIIISILFGISGGGENQEQEFDLRRPGAADAPKTIEAEISAEYDGYMTRERTALRILPREPSEAEAEELLYGLRQRLPSIILGNNQSLDFVNQNLILPDIDEETGADISWTSSDSRYITNEGLVNLLGVPDGMVITLTARITLASAQDAFHIAVKPCTEVSAEDVDTALRGRLEETIDAISNERTGEAAMLPAVTPDGIKLTWMAPDNKSGPAVIFVCVILVFLCFSGRYRTAYKQIKEAREEIERDFPDFIQKLSLLLGAGLVITSAIDRITEDYIQTREIYGRRRLYEELAAVRERMRSAGTPLVYEFSELARRSGLRELMRFNSTLADNIDKGSTLAEKLRAESGLLWDSRKKRAEKEGRVAETKLVFPMALQILSVIAITVVPAAFEMG